MVKYISTRGDRTERRSAEAIIRGLAPDKGLYVPLEIPKIDIEKLAKLASGQAVEYKEIADDTMRRFFDDFSDEEIRHCVEGAYTDKFDTPDIAPLIATKEAYFLELYHGRTSAFKDMALSILPYLLTTSLRKENEDKKIVILTATSGDTGKAALEGFADVQGTDIIVFYPKDGVSAVQERQMVTQEGANTYVFAIHGNFDDAQTGVKKIFSDSNLEKKLNDSGYRLSSANSINIGRLVPQVAYYIWAYMKLIESGKIAAGDSINAVVPTGNFGNILAAYYAREAGLPIKKLICASNENKILTDFINTGVYDANRDFILTSSPSMDILISSNLERLLYHLSGGNADEIAGYMTSLEKERRYVVSDKIRSNMNDFYGGFAEMERTHASIGTLYRNEGYLMDTHTAVAYRVYLDYKEKTGDNTPAVIASTASAYKFADKVAAAIGLPPEPNEFAYIDALNQETGVPVPAGLKGLQGRTITNDRTIDIPEMPEVIKSTLGLI